MIKYIVICIIFIFNISVFAQDEDLILQEGVYKNFGFAESVKLNTVPFFNPELLNRAEAAYTYDFAEIEQALKIKFELNKKIIEDLQSQLSDIQIENLLITTEKSFTALEDLVNKTRNIVGEQVFENVYQYVQFTDETLNLMVQNGELAIASRDSDNNYRVLNNEGFIKNAFGELSIGNKLILVHKKDSFIDLPSTNAIITWDAQESVALPAK